MSTMEDCVFCDIISGKAPVKGLRHEDYRVASFVPLNPVTKGHRLFVPVVHVADASSNAPLTGSTFEAAARWGIECDEQYNLIVNSGQEAGQTVFHLHVHYVPRKENDGLILPWDGGKVK